MLLEILVIGMLGGMAALVALEIFQEVRGGSGKLSDRYHP
jgi:hypothetical protein